MKGQHPVTATRFARTALAISFVLKFSCLQQSCTSPDTTVCVIPPDAAAKHIVRAILPTAAWAVFPKESPTSHSKDHSTCIHDKHELQGFTYLQVSLQLLGMNTNNMTSTYKELSVCTWYWSVSITNEPLKCTAEMFITGEFRRHIGRCVYAIFNFYRLSNQTSKQHSLSMWFAQLHKHSISLFVRQERGSTQR